MAAFLRKADKFDVSDRVLNTETGVAEFRGEYGMKMQYQTKNEGEMKALETKGFDRCTQTHVHERWETQA